MTGDTRISKLREVAATLEEVIAQLESVDALIAAAHIQAGLDSVTSMVDEPGRAPGDRDE